MSEEGSVTIYLRRLKAGDRAALQQLWEGYFGRLVGVARKRLQEVPCPVIDGEDVALSAFDSFYRAVEKGRFPRLDNRDDLWQVLVLLAVRKASNVGRHVFTQQQGGGQVVNASALDKADEDGCAFKDAVGREADPAFAVLMADQCGRLLTMLPTPELRTIAVWKMEGRTNEEIADLLELDPSTIERKLVRIRSEWKEKAAE